MGRGGARPGAGRKKQIDITRGNPQPKTHASLEVAAAHSSDAQKLIEPHIAELVGLGLGLSRGVLAEDPKSRIVYRTTPNIKAITYLLDRACGKPTETVKAITTDEAESFFNDMTERLELLLDEHCDTDTADKIKNGLNDWIGTRL